MNWLKKTLADVAGTQEPIYGPEAIQPVTKQAEKIPYTELTKNDLKWTAPQHTSVETQTFYLMADNGALCFLQVIYSNVMGLQTTASFNSKIYSVAGDAPHIWHTDTLNNIVFDPDMFSFGADNLAVTLNEEGTAYTIKSAVSDDSLVNITLTRQTPGLVIGENGTSFFGTDPQKPWGSMRHVFWPRCSVGGTITTKDKTFDFTGRGVFVYALQGMKPHHAAGRWNFVNMQTPSYSAFMMEFTTPPSYGSTVVNVGGIIENDKILYAGATNTATHVEAAQDSENDWPEPKKVKYVWDGKTKSDAPEPVHAELEGSLGKRLDRIDVMAEVPGFIKSIVGSVAGTKPYIYQYYPQDGFTLKVKVGDKETEEQGKLFAEATFIC